MEPWTTDRIREAFIYDGGEAEFYDPINGAREQRRFAGEVFDRWLEEHDRQQRAEAWRAGYEEGFGDGGVNAWDPQNPYLTTEPETPYAGGTYNEGSFT